jgi:hypothetical protein
MAKIASTSFSTGPKDSVATVDVYADAKPTTAAPREPSVKESVLKAVKSVQNNVSVFKDLGDSAIVEDGKLSFETKENINRMKEIVGGDSGPLNDIKNTLINKALTALGCECCGPEVPDIVEKPKKPAISGKGGIPKGERNCSGGALNKIKNLKQTIDGVEQTIKSGDYKSAKGITSLLNTVAGEDSPIVEMLDLEAQAGMLGAILEQATVLGIPSAIDTIIDKISDDKQKRKVLVENLMTSIIYSDMKAINKIIDIVGAGGVLARIPDAVNLILTFYRIPIGSRVSNYPTLLTALTDTLARINSKWDKYGRTVLRDQGGGVMALEVDEINNLEPFTYASIDAHDLFALSVTHRTSSMIARTYPSRDILAIAKEMYPKVAFDV